MSSEVEGSENFLVIFLKENVMDTSSWIAVLLCIIALEMGVIVFFILKIAIGLAKAGPKWPRRAFERINKDTDGKYDIWGGEGDGYEEEETARRFKKKISILDIIEAILCAMLDLHAQSIEHFHTTHKQLNNLILDTRTRVNLDDPAAPANKSP